MGMASSSTVVSQHFHTPGQEFCTVLFCASDASHLTVMAAGDAKSRRLLRLLDIVEKKRKRKTQWIGTALLVRYFTRLLIR